MPGQIPRHVFTVMCEDIRQEERGKVSLLGTYSENILFKERPMRIRSLAFFDRFHGGEGTFLVTAKLKSSSAELIKGIELKDVAFPASNDSTFTNLGMVIGNIEFKEEGLHQYEVYFDNVPDPIIKFSFGVYVRPEVFGSK